LSLRLLGRDRRSMFDALSRVPGLTIFPSQGNFILVKAPNMWDGVELRDYLVANHGVCVRECGNKLGMTSQYLRPVVRPSDDVDRLVEGLYAYGRNLRGQSETTTWTTPRRTAAALPPRSAAPASTSSAPPRATDRQP